jgi:fructose-1,6-bisphosphatase I
MLSITFLFSASRFLSPFTRSLQYVVIHVLLCSYCMYGSSTELVLTFGEGVHMFSYDPSLGEFLLTRRNVMIPEKPQRIYSCNEANYASFPKGFQQFLDFAKSGEKPYSLRYVGSMVADVHRTLLYGGVFCYGPTSAAPAGKLRLLYEVNPMSMIMEQAGGKATTGTQRALDVMPTKVHQRVPIYLGCVRDVDLILGFLTAESEAGHGTATGSGAVTAGK